MREGWCLFKTITWLYVANILFCVVVKFLDFANERMPYYTLSPSDFKFMLFITCVSLGGVLAIAGLGVSAFCDFILLLQGKDPVTTRQRYYWLWKEDIRNLIIKIKAKARG